MLTNVPAQIIKNYEVVCWMDIKEEGNPVLLDEKNCTGKCNLKFNTWLGI